MKDRLFYTILELAQGYHNAKMTGQPWTDKQQNQALKSIMHDILALYGVDLDAWLDTLNYWDDDVREASERQDAEPRYNDYNKVIDEIYNLKMGK